MNDNLYYVISKYNKVIVINHYLAKVYQKYSGSFWKRKLQLRNCLDQISL